MVPLSNRRLFAYCLAAALVGVPVAVTLFPNDGVAILAVPILVLAVLTLLDGYLSVG